MSQTMKCKDCVLKHLAAAMSYAKEILAGHGIGGTPDHRPDYLGELVNAEHHLENMSTELLDRVMVLRTAAQMKRMLPSEQDVDALREIWTEIEGIDFDTDVVHRSMPANITGGYILPHDKTGRTVKVYRQYPGLEKMDRVGVVLDTEWFKDENEERLEMFKKLADRHMINGELLDTVDDYDGKYLWVFPFNVFIALDVDMRTAAIARVSEGRAPSFIMRVVDTEEYKKALPEAGSPCKAVDAVGMKGMPDIAEEAAAVYVTRKPCCSVKSQLRTCPFVKVNDDGWPYMKEIWETE